MSREVELLVIGAGPAGLSAALSAASTGIEVVLATREDRLGGQLIKQTHKFFGSRDQRAGTRGIEIARQLSLGVEQNKLIQVWPETTILGYEPDRVVTYERQLPDRTVLGTIRAQRIIAATGASERPLLFPNNDLPGIYGAGAVQTLMNVFGVRPGRKALMIGAGNIGLIVSYQLVQAGVEVVAVVEAADRIGGYTVHASKLRRMGIPILTRSSIKEALGENEVRGAILWRLGPDWRGIEGTEQHVEVDMICLAVGLSPLAELLWQAGCELRWVPELGGHVPVTDENQETTVSGVYAAGDLAGVEEASSAMIAGQLAGLAAAASLGKCPDFEVRSRECHDQLAALRSGPAGAKIRAGLQVLRHSPDSSSRVLGSQAGEAASTRAAQEAPLGTLLTDGAPTEEQIRGALPSPERLARGPVALFECFQAIPCDPCHVACRQGAVKPFLDIHSLPAVDFEICTGCAQCVAACPGLAVFAVDLSGPPARGRVCLPYEFVPLPKSGELVQCLDHHGRPICQGEVERVLPRRDPLSTPLVWLSVPREYALKVRFIRQNRLGGSSIG